MTDNLENNENQKVQEEKIEIRALETESSQAEVDERFARNIRESIKNATSAEGTLNEAPPAGSKEEAEAYVETFKPTNNIEKGLLDVVKEHPDVKIDENVAKLLRILGNSVGEQKKTTEETMSNSLANAKLGGASEEDLNSVISPLKENELYKNIGLNETQEKLLAAAIFNTQKHKPADRVAPVVSSSQVQKDVDVSPMIKEAIDNNDVGLYRKAMALMGRTNS